MVKIISIIPARSGFKRIKEKIYDEERSKLKTTKY